MASAEAASAPSLFVAPAAEGSLRPVAGRAGVFDLVLRGARPVVRFTDRPSRDAGQLRPRTLVARWRALGFAADPPNAALAVAGAPAGRDVVVLTLTRPRVRDGGRTLAFRARLVARPGSGLSSFVRRADRRVARRFGAADLFIDASAATTSTVQVQVQRLPAGQALSLQFDVGAVVQTLFQVLPGTSPTVFASENRFAVTAGPDVLSGGGSIRVAGAGLALTGTAQIPAGTTVVLYSNGGVAAINAAGPFSVGLVPD